MRGRVPALVQAAVVAVMLAVVAAVSLSARQPPPPSVAEYAPQAVAQIQQAPPELSLDQGRGGSTTTTAPPDGGGGGPSSDSTTSTSREVIEKPRVRQCVGDPGRQIEDPQSPPCVAYFDPNTSNGGATSRGVTGETITITWTPDFFETDVFVKDFAKFFNRRFEFYRREIKLEMFNASGTDANPALMQADAQTAYEKQAFASLNYTARSGAEYSYYDALAEKGIISISHRVQAQATDAHFRQRSPYQWSVVPTVDVMLRNYGQFICASLAGKAPAYADGTAGSAPTRVFGAIVQEAADGSRPDLKPLEDEMARCGASIKAKVNDRVTAETTRTGQGVVAAMTNANVTSVICLCDGKELREVIMPAASAQVYEPEWLIGSYLDNDLDNSLNGAPPEQAANAFGLLFRNKLLPKQDMPFFWALKEVNPASDPQGGAYFSVQARYASMLLLASGIQMAGPHLTPDTFAAGLLRTRWANPGAGAAPYFQAPVGFDGGRRTFIDDAALFWHDPGRQSTVDSGNTGAVCYVRRGQRYRLGTWPVTDHPFFTGPCL
jgi:hypothetical protein